VNVNPGTLLCCGNVVHDILVRPVDEIRFDSTAWVDAIEPSIGGNGANTSYAVAKLGGAVRLVSFVGDDEFGRAITTELASVGVDVQWLRKVPGGRTATTVGLVNSSGARAFFHHPGVNLTAFHDGLNLRGDAGSGCSHFHLANPFTGVEIRRHAANLLAEARGLGWTTSMDTGWDARGEWMSVVGGCLASIDLLFVNEDEARMLTGCADPPAAARVFIDRGTRAVVVKLGSKGCAVFESAREEYVPGFQVNAVDSTGAGDCFVGAFLVGLRRGMDLAGAARFANAAGALSVGRLGAVTGLLSIEETLAWMRESSSF